MKILKTIAGEYMDRLLLILAGFGVGVKVMVINHEIDPAALNLSIMPSDYVILLMAPLAVAMLSVAINKWLPEDLDDDEDQAALQELTNEILDIATLEGYTNIRWKDIQKPEGV